MASEERVQSPHPTPDRDSFIEKIIEPTGVSAAVVAAFTEVDRAEFMYRGYRDRAYTDRIIDLIPPDSNMRRLPEATISQPSLVATMIDMLELDGRGRVLEVGTATGYQAAVLSRLADEVDTVEIDPRLAYWAQSNLKRLHYPNVTVHKGDGLMGVPERAPFDAIIITAGLRDIPAGLVDQLAVGGRLVAPIGELPTNSHLIALTKTSKTETTSEEHGWCTFVPLYSPEPGGWTAEAMAKARQQRKEELATRQAARREDMKRRMIQESGEDVYLDFIRGIGRTAGAIVDKKLSEDQALDLVDCFGDVFFRQMHEEEAEEVESEQVAGADSHEPDRVEDIQINSSSKNK